MAKIATYVVDTNVQLTDMVIGTDVGDNNITKNYRISDIIALASGGGASGVSSIRKLGEASGLNGNVNFEGGTGISIAQSAAGEATAKLTISLTGGSPLTSFTTGIVDGTPITINSTNNQLLFKAQDDIELTTLTGDTIVVGMSDQSSVVAGAYTNADVTVNPRGIITAISNGTGGGTTVEANPSGAATIVLTKLKVDTDIYSIPSATQVSVTAPLNNSGTTTAPVLGIAQANTSTNGFLSAGDWNTFNGKQSDITLTTVGTSGVATFNNNTINIPDYGSAASGSVTSVGATTPIVSSGGSTPTISVLAASGSQSGVISPANFNTFNGKQNAITLTTTGDTGPSTWDASTSTLNVPTYIIGGGGTNTSSNDVVWSGGGLYDYKLENYKEMDFKPFKPTTGSFTDWQSELKLDEKFYLSGLTTNQTTNWHAYIQNADAGYLNLVSENLTNSTFSKIEIDPADGVSNIFTCTVEGRIVEGLFASGSPSLGFWANCDLQRWYGGKTDSLPDDVIEAWNVPNATVGTIRLPQNAEADESSISVSSTDDRGKIWMNPTTGEISYVDTNSSTCEIQRLQHYGQKSYVTLANVGNVYTMDLYKSTSAIIIGPQAGGALSLAIQYPESGDYGNVIVDLSAVEGATTLALPSNSKVANNGSGAIALAAGQVHTLTFTYSTHAFPVFYWTYALNYT